MKSHRATEMTKEERGAMPRNHVKERWSKCPLKTNYGVCSARNGKCTPGDEVCVASVRAFHNGFHRKDLVEIAAKTMELEAELKELMDFVVDAVL